MARRGRVSPSHAGARGSERLSVPQAGTLDFTLPLEGRKGRACHRQEGERSLNAHLSSRCGKHFNLNPQVIFPPHPCNPSIVTTSMKLTSLGTQNNLAPVSWPWPCDFPSAVPACPWAQPPAPRKARTLSSSPLLTWTCSCGLLFVFLQVVSFLHWLDLK